MFHVRVFHYNINIKWILLWTFIDTWFDFKGVSILASFGVRVVFYVRFTTHNRNYKLLLISKIYRTQFLKFKSHNVIIAILRFDKNCDRHHELTFFKIIFIFQYKNNNNYSTVKNVRSCVLTILIINNLYPIRRVFLYYNYI